jgi:hypothetical protein
MGWKKWKIKKEKGGSSKALPKQQVKGAKVYA